MGQNPDQVRMIVSKSFPPPFYLLRLLVILLAMSCNLDRHIATKFTILRDHNCNDACIVAYIAVHFRIESANRSENVSHRKGDLLRCTSHRLFWSHLRP